MPTYDYVCDGCQHEFEHRQSMTSNRLRTCPQCKRRKLRRLIGSGAGVIFKGSGFYETDYKRKADGGKPAPAPSEAPSGKPESGKPATPTPTPPMSTSSKSGARASDATPSSGGAEAQ